FDFERMGFVAARALVGIVAAKSANGRKGPANAASAAAKREPLTIPIGPLLVTRRKSTAGRGRHEPWILKAVETIRAEACNGLTIDCLVERLRTAGGRPVSRRNFDRRFREAMGHTAKEEILSVRLESACALLAQTETPVTSINDFCGFEDYHTLNAQFRLRFKMPMTRWREMNAR
ncbi:MAG: helix-turn-helix transcriptional regulator, partial [Kiritimatiellae bacterium]|nr:helix-turn-helix transcriptional regulator [Kiritimatiellia bacterium]